MTSSTEPARATPPTGDRRVVRTRLRLVDAVRDEVAATGGFTAEDVTRRAGSSPATFYNHFPTKDDALLAAFAAAMSDLVTMVDSELRIESLLERGLDDFAAEWVALCAAFFRENCLVFRAAQTRIPVSKSFRAVFREHENAAFERYLRFVRLGQAAQVLREGDAEPIARAMMIASEGWNHPSVLKMEPGDGLHRELAAGFVLTLSRGAKPPSGERDHGEEAS